MQDLVDLRNYFDVHYETEPLVLCTLVRKRGSSYRDVGAKKIVGSEGHSCGLLSGGCLEASIEKVAREARSKMPLIESFSTLSEEDRLMGYQTGCQGQIEILFEVMNPVQLHELDLMIPFGSEKKSAGVRVTLKSTADGNQIGHREFSTDSSTIPDTLFEPWIEPVKLVIIGCGPDAEAYLPLAKAMGWEIQFFDYRNDLVKADWLVAKQVTYAAVTDIGK